MECFLREPWRENKPALGVWNTIASTLVAEAIASLGPDYVCVDMQHGSVHDGMLVEALQAIVAGGSVPLVRVRDNTPALIMRALDAGARGVIVPLVETREEVMRAVDACRFPPRGSRSFGPFRASITSRTSDYRELEKVACIVMIETRSGLKHIDDIVSVDGLTGVYVGPSDLSLALGLEPGSVDAPEYASAVTDIREACVSNGVVAGMHCYDGKRAREAIENGFGMVTVCLDLRLLQGAVTGELRAARGEG